MFVGQRPGFWASWGDRQAVVALIPVLQDEHYRVRPAAVKALGILQDARAITPLLQCLKDPSKRVQRELGRALTKLGDPAIKSLFQALQDPNPLIRRNAAQLLGRIGDTRAIQSLTEALQDPNQHVRRRAREVIVRLQAQNPREE